MHAQNATITAIAKTISPTSSALLGFKNVLNSVVTAAGFNLEPLDSGDDDQLQKFIYGHIITHFINRGVGPEFLFNTDELIIPISFKNDDIISDGCLKIYDNGEDTIQCWFYEWGAKDDDFAKSKEWILDDTIDFVGRFYPLIQNACLSIGKIKWEGRHLYWK